MTEYIAKAPFVIEVHHSNGDIIYPQYSMSHEFIHAFGDSATQLVDQLNSEIRRRVDEYVKE